jgi:hypothetical protein
MSTEMLSPDQEALALELAQRAELTCEIGQQITVGAAREELLAIERELRRRVWVGDPTTWAEERLRAYLWSIQKKIMESVRKHRKTAVPSCHEAGKSYIAAGIVSWWLDVHRPGEAFAVTSAPTGRQVKAILWREIGRAHGLGQLPGRTNQTEWLMVNPRTGKEELVAFGQKPADMDPGAFQGIHARRVLVVFDEACGMPKALWDAADSLIANDDSRFLAIGNPDDPHSEFAEVCKPGSSWNTIPISVFDTPNFTGEDVPEELRHVLVGRLWVEEKRKKWGEKSPLYQAKVLGRFPDRVADGLIPFSAIKAAQARELRPDQPDELGVDVGAGGDKNVVCRRRGPVARIIREDQEPDTMISCGNLLADLRSTRASIAKVDAIGIGRGLVDRAREQNQPVRGINVSVSPTETAEASAEFGGDGFANLRAQAYWELRERFLSGAIDIDEEDDDLANQLASMKYKRTSKGKILVESKDDMRRRGLASPDRADALMLAFLNPPEEEEESGGVLW